MLPAMAAGLVRIWACDPKLMELAFGRALFDRYGRYAADPVGKQRDHTPTPEYPFVVVLVDEIAFLTAYQADRKLKDRILAAPATLTTQGRAVGYCVVAALQDPRKEVLNIRNLFPTSSRCASTSRPRSTTCLATARGTGAPSATRSLLTRVPGRAWPTSAWRLRPRPL